MRAGQCGAALLYERTAHQTADASEDESRWLVVFPRADYTRALSRFVRLSSLLFVDRGEAFKAFVRA
jgi:hypothetical protein